MKSMFFREIPDWELILKTIDTFEKEFNYVKGQGIMTTEILIRNYRTEDTQALANIYFYTIHRINIKHYTQEQAMYGLLNQAQREKASLQKPANDAIFYRR